jgi:hypothetical protein
MWFGNGLSRELQDGDVGFSQVFSAAGVNAGEASSDQQVVAVRLECLIRGLAR